jgi:phosphate starvation-inducible PhoH-like protein
LPKKDSRQNKKSKFEQERECYYEVTLDNEQIEAAQKIKDNDISILVGKAGSGKTYVACAVALQMLLKGEVEKIIIARPVPKDQLGFLPGDIKEKQFPLFIPIIENFYKMYNKAHINYLLEHDKIEMLPIQYVRGRTIDHAVLILDESQNNTLHEFKAIFTRIGEGSKIICTGDYDQIDLRDKKDSGLKCVSKFIIDNFCSVDLQNEHRKQIVINILNEFEKIGV